VVGLARRVRERPSITTGPGANHVKNLILRSTLRTILCGTLLAGLSASALAKGGTPQNHHCVKDGATLEGKTKKDCKKEGGKWEKDAASEAAKAPEAK
jgi:hypothetical protein